ncbi:hypothetical protein [Polaromonas sp. JS666]|uniref:hypothetical protein n=1 Tax=Polaromonas sp. (strain JS666 / ATCC BAA-500) TaxID=296591 RepID=UPI0002FFA2D8|nr:hypothetical protein [Polaromonas sp. JS666]
MSNKLILGVSLMLAAASSLAGGASGQFSVQITLNSAGSNSCTSASDSGTASSSVQVRCTTNVFVEIAARTTTSTSTSTTSTSTSRFMPGYRPARDSLLPDYCRSELSRADRVAGLTCRLDDRRQFAAAGDEGDEGWAFESRLYAVNTEDTPLQMQARSRVEDDHGTLTSIRLASADGRSGPVEMLVSF